MAQDYRELYQRLRKGGMIGPMGKDDFMKWWERYGRRQYTEPEPTPPRRGLMVPVNVPPIEGRRFGPEGLPPGYPGTLGRGRGTTNIEKWGNVRRRLNQRLPGGLSNYPRPAQPSIPNPKTEYPTPGRPKGSAYDWRKKLRGLWW